MNTAEQIESWKESIAEFHPESRAWVYQANRTLKESESSEIQSALNAFVIQWAAHGSSLTAKGFILYNRFIVLVADESRTPASGCSIDGSVNFLRSLENQYQIQLLERTDVAFINVQGLLQTTHFSKIKELLSIGTLSGQSTVFNNSVATKQALIENWIIPLSQSWLKKYL